MKLYIFVNYAQVTEVFFLWSYIDYIYYNPFIINTEILFWGKLTK